MPTITCYWYLWDISVHHLSIVISCFNILLLSFFFKCFVGHIFRCIFCCLHNYCYIFCHLLDFYLLFKFLLCNCLCSCFYNGCCCIDFGFILFCNLSSFQQRHSFSYETISFFLLFLYVISSSSLADPNYIDVVAVAYFSTASSTSFFTNSSLSLSSSTILPMGFPCLFKINSS